MSDSAIPWTAAGPHAAQPMAAESTGLRPRVVGLARAALA
jgi:hypothetical protein